MHPYQDQFMTIRDGLISLQALLPAAPVFDEAWIG